MKLHALLVAVFALPMAAGAGADERDVVVTGHNWAPFISPMGEPFRARTATDNTLANWFYGADRNRDGALTEAEMVADADRFFALLDTKADGQIDPDELIHYEWEVAPDIQVNSRTRRQPGTPPDKPSGKPASWDEFTLDGGDRPRPRSDRRRANGLQGAARYALLNMPQPVAAADTDLDRSITRGEFRAAAVARFQLLDEARQGRLALASLQARLTANQARKRSRNREDEEDARLGIPLPPGN